MKNIRTSSYMIPVKLEKEEGKYMLIHGYTGAIDIVTENLLVKIKKIADGHDFSEPMLQSLLKRGYITTKTEEEEYAYVARIAKAIHKKYDILYSTFTWVVTYNCNFRCPYCYEEKEPKNSHCEYTFTKEQVDLAYQAQEIIQPNRQLRKKTITLYGGEPLLAKNQKVIKYIVEQGRKKGYIFSAITNGYELNSFIDLLGADKIYKLQITIDGTKEIHNRRRPHYKDKNTFDRIIDNIELALQKEVQISVRMNTDNLNIDNYSSLKEFFKQKGFLNNTKFHFYLGLIKDNQCISDESRKNLDFMPARNFVDKQKLLGLTPFKEDSGIYRKICDAIKNKKPYVFNSITCVAQSSGNILDPFGNIYPCWEVINDKNNIKGVYSKNGVTWNNDVIDKWKHSNITYNSQCKYCKYALICGGGCPYYREKKQLNDCIIFRKTFDTIINKAYAKYK